MRDQTIIPPVCLVGKPNNCIPFGYTKLTPVQVKKLYGSYETVLFGIGNIQIAYKPLTLQGGDDCNYFMLTFDYNRLFCPKKATVDGVEIVLTPEQVAKIEDTKKEQEKNRVKKGDVLIGFEKRGILTTYPNLDSSIFYASGNGSLQFWRSNYSYENVADCMKIPVFAHRFSKIRKATPEEITMFKNLERERVRD